MKQMPYALSAGPARADRHTVSDRISECLSRLEEMLAQARDTPGVSADVAHYAGMHNIVSALQRTSEDHTGSLDPELFEAPASGEIVIEVAQREYHRRATV